MNREQVLRIPADANAGKTPLLFLALVLIFSVPFYFLEQRSLLPEGMPFIAVTALMVFVPMSLALAFTFKEGNLRSVRSLLARAVDVHKVKPLLWWCRHFCCCQPRYIWRICFL